jgi:hypothetical protein
MATRGAVGYVVRRDPLLWVGVYNHWDSYPSGLLRALFEEVLPRFDWNIEQAIRHLMIKHPGGWSHIASYDDGDPECYCHSERFVGKDGTVRRFVSGLLQGCDCDGSEDPECNPVSIEWVYLFDVTEGTVLILASVWREGRYRHEVVSEVPVSTIRIDYEGIEKVVNDMYRR